MNAEEELKQEVEKLKGEILSLAKALPTSLCKCAYSFSLAQFLIDTTMNWTRDAVMQGYVPEHLDRISKGLSYLEKDCGIDMGEAELSLQEAMTQAQQKDWDKTRVKLDNLYIQTDRKVANRAGYITPHF